MSKLFTADADEWTRVTADLRADGVVVGVEHGSITYQAKLSATDRDRLAAHLGTAARAEERQRLIEKFRRKSAELREGAPRLLHVHERCDALNRADDYEAAARLIESEAGEHEEDTP